ncbi:hypothetical protein COL01_11485 [Bacillus thuringiensis]|uniref:Uncharacterized protein n=1 Tax=Bacillus thuringiensis TaxID=1428 RepID=A0A9X6WSF4_BACTU|nr:hypothetical protein [Bacillus thuringiensis]PFJ42574.1 hypothetical protein COJ15_05950 [Bacillus thuringiensis]PFN60565.1 hypothetical protein COJ75_11095 [Bacillus thuringiensis]PFV34471.1 hypothetical protein COL01_11485 [Bacillus thuringiensis]
MIFKNKEHTLLDFEIDLITDSSLQLDFYGAGIQNINRFFLGIEEDFGKNIRPGVIRVNSETYKKMEIEVEQLLLDDNLYKVNLIKRGYIALKRLKQLIYKLNSTSISDITEPEVDLLSRCLIEVLSMTAFNWLVPNKKYKQLFIKFFGEKEGNRIYLDLSIPDSIPHFLLLNLELHKLALNKIIGNDNDFEKFKDYFGCLLNFGFQDSKYENDEGIQVAIDGIIETSKNIEEIKNYINDIYIMKAKAKSKKLHAYKRIFKTVNEQDLKDVISTCKIIEFINEEEEVRHILQMQAQRILKKLINFRNGEITNTVLEDILMYRGVSLYE